MKDVKRIFIKIHNRYRCRLSHEFVTDGSDEEAISRFVYNSLFDYAVPEKIALQASEWAKEAIVDEIFAGEGFEIIIEEV